MYWMMPDNELDAENRFLVALYTKFIRWIIFVFVWRYTLSTWVVYRFGMWFSLYNFDCIFQRRTHIIKLYIIIHVRLLTNRQYRHMLTIKHNQHEKHENEMRKKNGMLNVWIVQVERQVEDQEEWFTNTSQVHLSGSNKQ